MSAIYKTLLFFIVSSILVSCSSVTKLSSVWRSTSADAELGFETFAILVLSDNTSLRGMVEDQLGDQLEAKGKRVIRSIDIIPPSFKDQQMDKDYILDSLIATGADAIVTVAFLDENVNTRFTSTTVPYTPVSKYGWYGSFWGYYSHWFSRIYYEELSPEKRYFTEVNVYSTKNETLIWSAQSDIWKISDFELVHEAFSKLVVKEMERDQLFDKSSEE